MNHLKNCNLTPKKLFSFEMEGWQYIKASHITEHSNGYVYLHYSFKDDVFKRTDEIPCSVLLTTKVKYLLILNYGSKEDIKYAQECLDNKKAYIDLDNKTLQDMLRDSKKEYIKVWYGKDENGYFTISQSEPKIDALDKVDDKDITYER